MADGVQPEVDDASSQMAAALASIRNLIGELQGGELFCMDRGYAWTLESESYRREIIADWFERLPILSERLPRLWGRLSSNETIGDRNDLIAEIDALAEFRPLK